MSREYPNREQEFHRPSFALFPEQVLEELWSADTNNCTRGPHPQIHDRAFWQDKEMFGSLWPLLHNITVVCREISSCFPYFLYSIYSHDMYYSYALCFLHSPSKAVLVMTNNVILSSIQASFGIVMKCTSLGISKNNPLKTALRVWCSGYIYFQVMYFIIDNHKYWKKMSHLCLWTIRVGQGWDLPSAL